MSSVLDSELLEHSSSIIVIVIILSFLPLLPFSFPSSTLHCHPRPVPLFPFITYLPLNILVPDGI